MLSIYMFQSPMPKRYKKGFIQKDECTKTILDESITKSREYKYLIIFNDVSGDEPGT